MRINQFLSIILTIIILLFSNLAKANVKEIIKEYENGNIQKALDIAEKKKFAHIALFLTSQKHIFGGHDTSFETITKFLDDYPNWPQRIALIKSAERRINNNTSKKALRKWFDMNKPLTGKGYYYYFLASKNHIKNDLRFQAIIKNTWVYANFPESEEEKFYKKYSYILNEEDHENKISEFFWRGDFKSAKKYFKLIGKEYKQVFKTWEAISKGYSTAEREFRRVKGSYRYHSGLLYAYLNSHKKDEPNKEMISLISKAPKDDAHSSQWWKLKHYFTRELIERKEYKHAYNIVAKHNATNVADMAEAEWLSGWLAFRFLDKPENALPHFENIYTISKTSISLSRGAYWSGRVLEFMNKRKAAYEWYNKSAEFGFTFYGQLAQYELRKRNIEIASSHKINEKDKMNFKKNPYADISIFLAYGKKNRDLLKIYAREAFFVAKAHGEAAYILQRLRVYLNTSDTVMVAKLAQQAGVLVKDAAFPMPYTFPKWVDNKILSYSITRQESIFNKSVISSADARGLMQLMPKTAKAVAQNHKIRFSARKLLDPQYNMKLGSLHLKDLYQEYKNYAMSIATYNAGTVVYSWNKRMGDIREMKLYEAIDWIESIPYYETRDYVQRVIENMQIYKTIIDKNNKLITHKLIVN